MEPTTTLEGMAINREFWRDKRVFLTGHTGFKGAWLSLWLQQLGAELTGYALTPPTQPNVFDLADVGKGMDSIIGDVRDAHGLSTAIRNAQPEIVIHLAAQPLVRYSYQHPVETYATNVLGTVNLLETARQIDSVRVVLIITSDKCYENRESSRAFQEGDAMGGFDPYSSSKACAELIAAAYRNSYFHTEKYSQHGVALATARAGNVIGGGDWAIDRLIPDAIRAATNNEIIKVRNPHAIRPWQHVLDPLYGYLLLAQMLYQEGAVFAEAWNFGAMIEETKSVQSIVDKFAKLWGENVKWELSAEANQPHESHYLNLDCSKAKTKLKWQPQLSIDEALKMTVDWHQAFIGGCEMYSITSNQISILEAKVGANSL